MNEQNSKQLALMQQVNFELEFLVGKFEEKYGVSNVKEAIGNLLLTLAMRDENIVKLTFDIVHKMNIGGIQKQSS